MIDIGLTTEFVIPAGGARCAVRGARCAVRGGGSDHQVV
jgi:hypothetical protein